MRRSRPYPRAWTPGRGGGRWRPLGLFALFAGAALLVALIEPPLPPLAGNAVAADGDSLRLGSERVRLLGIDAPELDQTCDRDGVSWPCGGEARDLLRDILRRGPLACTGAGRDQYGRILARCAANGDDVGAQLVLAGLAISADDYAAEQNQAKAGQIGLWSGTFQPPADWRREHETGAAGVDLLAWLRSLL